MVMKPHPCTLRQLQYAVAIAESLSFRLAAERCGVSQPSLSEQVTQMEAVLGVRLFERDKRKVLVTVEGREIIERARLILRATEDLVKLARHCRDPLAGKLSIGVLPTIAPYLLPRLTPVLRQAFPDLLIRWVEEKTAVVMRKLEAGELDAALLALEADIGDVERDIIAEDPFVLVAPLGHPLAASAAAVRLPELRGTSVFVLQDEHCFGQQAAEFCSGKDADIDAFRATSLTTLVQMVAEGAGVTLLPTLALPHEVADVQVGVRSFAEGGPCRTIALVWRRQYPFDSALRRVAAMIRQAYPAPSGNEAHAPRMARRSHDGQ